jgi:hypothetical protein
LAEQRPDLSLWLFGLAEYLDPANTRALRIKVR